MPRIIGASIYSEIHPGSDITDEEWTFMQAMAAYQKRWARRFPSCREVLFVVKCLGYRKVAEAVAPDADPVTVMESKRAAAAPADSPTTSA